MKKQNNKKKTVTGEQQKKSVPLYLRFAGEAACVVALIVVFFTLLIYESDYLMRVQELNLFLYTPLFFKQQLVVAGGLLTYLGTYFTQYFYHPWIGILLLCGWLGLMMWLMQRTFAIRGLWKLVLLVPVAMVLLTDFDLGYWVYYLKLRGHFFVTVIGVSMAVATTWLYRVLAVKAATKGKAGFALLLLFTIAIGCLAYPIGGYYGIVTIALMGIITGRISTLSRTQKSILCLVAIFMMTFIPRIFYRHVFYQANSDFILWQALPLYNNDEAFTAYHIPYVVIFVVLIFMASLYKINFSLKQWLLRPWMASVIPVLLAVGAVWSCWHFWYKDKTFHEEIQMNACVDECDWEGVLSIMRQHEGEPTRMMVMYKNLALFKLGRAGDELYNYPDGAKKPASDFELRMAQLGGKNIYLHYGMANYCYRWCLEDGVEMGWRAEYLKFLVRCSLLNGEWQVAQKYIDLLKQTKYHRQWAERYEPLATPAISELLPQHPEFMPILRLMQDQNHLGSDQALIELFLLNLQAHRVTNDPVCAELVLLSAMQLKDIPTFWRAFNQYAVLKKDGIIPRHFQEAAYLYGNLEHNVDISHMPFDPSIPASYNAFMQAAQQCQGMTEEQMKRALASRFGNTFYYNYFLMRGMKTY